MKKGAYNMKVYISQLTETENIIDLLEKYEIGLEIVLFASPYCLDRQNEFIENYKRELGDLYGKINLGRFRHLNLLIPFLVKFQEPVMN